MSGIESMIDKIMDKNYSGAADDFAAEMADRVTSALDNEKATVAAEIYGEAYHEDPLEGMSDEEIEEVLEGMSDEEFQEMLDEDGVDSLDELSGKTLGSYMVKNRASHKKAEKDYEDAVINSGDKVNKTKARKASRTMHKRRKGEERAIDKLRGSGFAKVHAT